MTTPIKEPPVWKNNKGHPIKDHPNEDHHKGHLIKDHPNEDHQEHPNESQYLMTVQWKILQTKDNPGEWAPKKRKAVMNPSPKDQLCW